MTTTVDFFYQVVYLFPRGGQRRMNFSTFPPLSIEAAVVALLRDMAARVRPEDVDEVRRRVAEERSRSNGDQTVER